MSGNPDQANQPSPLAERARPAPEDIASASTLKRRKPTVRPDFIIVLLLDVDSCLLYGEDSYDILYLVFNGGRTRGYMVDAARRALNPGLEHLVQQLRDTYSAQFTLRFEVVLYTKKSTVAFPADTYQWTDDAHTSAVPCQWKKDWYGLPGLPKHMVVPIRSLPRPEDALAASAKDFNFDRICTRHCPMGEPEDETSDAYKLALADRAASRRRYVGILSRLWCVAQAVQDLLDLPESPRLVVCAEDKDPAVLLRGLKLDKHHMIFVEDNKELESNPLVSIIPPFNGMLPEQGDELVRFLEANVDLDAINADPVVVKYLSGPHRKVIGATTRRIAMGLAKPDALQPFDGIPLSDSVVRCNADGTRIVGFAYNARTETTSWVLDDNVKRPQLVEYVEGTIIQGFLVDDDDDDAKTSAVAAPEPSSSGDPELEQALAQAMAAAYASV